MGYCQPRHQEYTIWDKDGEVNCWGLSLLKRVAMRRDQ